MRTEEERPNKKYDGFTRGYLLAVQRRSERNRLRLHVGLTLVAIVAVLAVMVACLTGRLTLFQTKRVLNCQVVGPVAHAHNKDCYDGQGNLVCPLPELEKHAHTDACYDDTGALTCTKPEVTVEHVHGPECFTEAAANGSEDEDAGFTTDGLFTYGIVSTAPDDASAREEGTGLKVTNVDASTKEAVSGVHFALYGEMINITRGTTHRAYSPMYGYEDIVVDSSGDLPIINISGLRPGTYYLTETEAPEGYTLMSDDLCFNVEQDGTITIESGGEASWLTSEQDDYGTTTYTLAVPNIHMKNVRLKKVSSGNNNKVLSGAAFELYAAEDYDVRLKQAREDAKPLTAGTTDDDGMLDLGSLHVGDYILVETKAPKGYKTLIDPVSIHIDTDITYMQSNNDKVASIASDEQDGTTWYEVEVWNSRGFILPRTGGSGTAVYVVLGGALITAAGLILLVKRLRARAA